MAQAITAAAESFQRSTGLAECEPFFGRGGANLFRCQTEWDAMAAERRKLKEAGLLRPKT